MAKKITSEQVIQNDLFSEAIRSADEFLAVADKIKQKLTENLQVSEQFFEAFRVKGAASINEFNEQYKKYNSELEASIRLEAETEKLKQAKLKTEQEQLKLDKQINQNLKAQIKEREKLQSAYKQESARLNELRNAYKDLAVAGKQNSAEAKELLKNITALDKKLKDIDKSVGQNQREVGNYGIAIKKLGGSIMGLAGAFGIGFGVGQIINFTSHLFELQDQLEATERKAAAVFGSAFPQLQQEAEDTANAMGLTNGEYIKTITNLTQLQQNLGFTAEEARRNATEILKTANTLSLFDAQGRGAAEVAEELASALTGATKPLKQYGIVVDKNLDIEEAQAQGLEATNKEMNQKAKALQILGQVTVQTNKLNTESVKELTEAEMAERAQEAEMRQAQEDLAMSSEALKSVWIGLVSTLGGLVTGIYKFGAAVKSLDKDTTQVGKTYDELFERFEEGNAADGSVQNFIKGVEALNEVQKQGRQFTGEFKKEFDLLAGSVLRAELTMEESLRRFNDLKRRQAEANAKDAEQAAKDNQATIDNANAEQAKKDREKRAKEAKEAADKAFDEELKALEKRKVIRETEIENETDDNETANELKLQADLDYLIARKELEEKYKRESFKTDLEIAQQKQRLTDLEVKKEVEEDEMLQKLHEGNLERQRQEIDDEEANLAEDEELQREHEERLREMREQSDEQERERLEEQFNKRKEFFEQIVEFAEEEMKRTQEMQEDAINKNISSLEKQIERQEELADKGASNMLAEKQAELAQEQLRLQQLQRQQIREQKELAFIKSFIAHLDFGDSPDVAFKEALENIAAISVVQGFFKDGVEAFQGKGTGTSDSNIVAISNKESIVTAQGTAETAGLVSDINADGRAGAKRWFAENMLPEMISRGELNLGTASNMYASMQLQQLVALNERIESLEDAVKSQPGFSVDFDSLGNLIEKRIKNGLAEIRKTPLFKDRF